MLGQQHYRSVGRRHNDQQPTTGYDPCDNSHCYDDCYNGSSRRLSYLCGCEWWRSLLGKQ